jgi:hypothetical protein
MSQAPIELSEILLRFDENKVIDLTELLSRDNPARSTFQGIPIAIENRAGTVREGRDPQGKPWQKLIKNDYGFIERVVGLDREWLDCFVGSDKLSPFVYVIRITEKNPKGDLLADESQDRVMLGFPSEDAALAALKANYDETLVVERVMPYYIWQFKEWLGVHGLPDVRLSDGESKPIAVDFDGVMARRQKIHREQKAGARIDKGFELVAELRKQGLAPYILTARTDLEFVEDWLRAEGLQIEVGNRKKPGTVALIDDRAVDFENHPLADILKSVVDKIQLAEIRKVGPLRDTLTPFWDTPVHRTETHINFRTIQSSMLHQADKLAAILKGPMRVKISRELAHQARTEARAGKEAHALMFSAPLEIRESLGPVVRAIYDDAASEARRETERLLGGRAPLALQEPPQTPQAEQTVEALVATFTSRVVNVYANVLRDFAAVEPEAEEDLFVSYLNSHVSESKLDVLADQVSREATRAGRADAFVVDPRLANAIWRRSSVLEPGKTCPPCWNASGEIIEGPDADLTEIHEGPSETCLCISFADLSSL